MEGLAPLMVHELAGVIGHLVARGDMSVIIVEQHAMLALSLARSAVILDRGRIVYRGSSSALSEDSPALDELIGIA